jgi:hypothetical protein
MSYASKKGWQGQKEFKDFLDKLFEPQGFQFISITGSEKNKKLAAGDVIIRQNTDPHNLCVLSDYFLEAKKQAQPNVFRDLEKAEDDAKMWGKHGAILYTSKQGRGHKGFAIIAMTPQTFARLIRELQGYRQESYKQLNNYEQKHS